MRLSRRDLRSLILAEISLLSKNESITIPHPDEDYVSISPDSQGCVILQAKAHAGASTKIKASGYGRFTITVSNDGDNKAYTSTYVRSDKYIGKHESASIPISSGDKLTVCVNNYKQVKGAKWFVKSSYV